MSKKINAENKTQYICEKAYEEFIQQGIHHFSLNKFIESLNMSKGQFYYYFKTKEELIYEVIKLKSQKILEHTAQQTKLGKTFLEKLFAFFSCYMEDSDPIYADLDKLIRDTFYLYFNVENEYIKKMNLDFYNFTLQYVEEIFEEMIQIGYLKEDSKKFVRSLIATADGMYFHSMINDDYNLKKYLSEPLADSRKQPII